MCLGLHGPLLSEQIDFLTYNITPNYCIQGNEMDDLCALYLMTLTT